MNQKLLVWLVLGSVFFSSLGCGFSFDLGKGTATPTLTSPPSSATATVTPGSSATPTPKATTPSVETPTPTPLPSPTPLPPEVISAENTGRLVNNRLFGIGASEQVAGFTEWENRSSSLFLTVGTVESGGLDLDMAGGSRHIPL
ncbi:MAG: hypothetical protein AB9891_09875 [Anaerolineaceae bacterium]